MSLLTKKHIEKIPSLYAQEDKRDPIVYLHIRCLNSFWLLTELDKDNELGFGYCQIIEGCGELGYVSLQEIEALPYPVIVIQVNKTLSQMKKELKL